MSPGHDYESAWPCKVYPLGSLKGKVYPPLPQDATEVEELLKRGGAAPMAQGAAGNCHAARFWRGRVRRPHGVGRAAGGAHEGIEAALTPAPRGSQRRTKGRGAFV